MAGLLLNCRVGVRVIRIQIIRYVRQWERRSLPRRKLEFAGVSLLLTLGMIVSVLPAPSRPVRVPLNKNTNALDSVFVGRTPGRFGGAVDSLRPRH